MSNFSQAGSHFPQVSTFLILGIFFWRIIRLRTLTSSQKHLLSNEEKAGGLSNTTLGLLTADSSTCLGFNATRPLLLPGQATAASSEAGVDSPADAVPSTTGCVLATLTSQMPSLWPMYSFTSWHTALDVVVLKLETIWNCDGNLLSECV